MPSVIGTVVVPGNLDGVHLGHQELLRQALEIAKEQRLKVTALTFDPHPMSVLTPDQRPFLLTSIQRKQELLLQYGVNNVWIETFDNTFSQLSAHAFIETILVNKLRAKAVILGPDFRFGANRQGNIETLKAAGKTMGFAVHPVTMKAMAGQPVSSTQVRHALQRGDIELATTLLGRPYDIEGTVVRGHQRGRTLGFPTANLKDITTLLPADGVYATVVRRMDRPHSPLLLGVTNLGTSPTFETPPSMEVHLFDMVDDLYGERLRVAFGSRLRAQRKFTQVADLKAQIRADCQHARTVLQVFLPQCRSL